MIYLFVYSLYTTDIFRKKKTRIFLEHNCISTANSFPNTAKYTLDGFRNNKAKLWWHISAARYEIVIVIILENFHENDKIPGNFI